MVRRNAPEFARRWSIAIVALLFTAARAPMATSQPLSGAWRDGLAVHLVQLDLRHDVAAARVSGTLSLFGMSTAVAGPATGNSFEVSSLNGLAAAAEIVSVKGRLDKGALVLTIAQKGEVPLSVTLRRTGSATEIPTDSSSSAQPESGARRALGSIASSARSALSGAGSSIRDLASRGGNSAAAFNGAWEFVSDDGTTGERLELSVTDDRVRGQLTAYRRGYFSGRTTTDASLRIEGVLRGDRLDLRLSDPSTGNTITAQATRRDAYLVLRSAGRETGYARPGTPLVQSADASSDASALANAVAGRVFQTSGSASGSGASVGGRIRLAVCANGEIAYDVSDLASASGPSFGETMDMGSSASRRGQWSVVLYAGAPAIMARWRGTGTSYALTAYFALRPLPDGRAAELNGIRLPVTGRC